MSKVLFLVGALSLQGVAFYYGVNYQTRWVICENPVSGVRQTFPRQCPSGWIFVDVAG